MNIKLKNIIVSISFMFILIGFMIYSIALPDKEISYEERRKLSQFPKFTVESLIKGEYFQDMEEYCSEQFPLRQTFRKFKTFISTNILKEKDNNDIFIIDDSIYKMEYTLNEDSIYDSADLYNKISSTYFKNSNIYYTIVPDKNYFAPKDKGYLSLDYKKLIDIMKENTEDMKYIDIMENLEIDDYYRTDLHWKQENLLPVAENLLTSMNNDYLGYKYKENQFENFYGSYYGQAASNVNPDKLIYLSNEIIEQCKVYDFEKQKYMTVYDDEDFKNVDPYDVYLGGAKALLSIENPNNTNGKELYIFRDSFGSSLAPLLISEYSKVTLIDLRYINTTELKKYINPKENSDVLFMYNTMILNNSVIINK